MNDKTANSQLDILGNGHRSDQEIFGSVLEQWRKKLGYCSIFAAVSAMTVSQLPATRSAEAKEPQASVPGQRPRRLEKLIMRSSNPASLKRQSQFLLPHQKGNVDMLTALAGVDDCPGVPISGGNYTAANPYTVSGDTTGANDTVTGLGLRSYYYYWDAHGPDNVYSFTLTGWGANPQIEVSTTSGTYRPLIYVLNGDCPAGTGNFGPIPWRISDSRWTSGNTATLQMNHLPLNVPLHLFVDSAFNDAAGAGPYTIRMQDVTIAAAPSPIDDPQFFVRQQYLDFLNREPDQSGDEFWINQITSCGTDQLCIEVKRINVSAAFFLSIEFQQTGYLVYRMYKAAYGNLPDAPVPVNFSVFMADTQEIGHGVVVLQPGWEMVLENNKQAFADEFVNRSQFTSAYPSTMSAADFVDALNASAGSVLTQTERDRLVSDLSSGTETRGQVLRAVAENPQLITNEFNRAFVLMQYFGYLRRDPNSGPDTDFTGYNFWLNKLNQFAGNYLDAEMVKAFITSTEYRQRFGL